jgi:hypothetical protein
MGRRGKATLVVAVDPEGILNEFDDTALAEGVALAADGSLQLSQDGEIQRCFKKDSWDEAALWALRRVGRLEEATHIKIAGSTSLTSLMALRGLERLERLEASGCKDRLTSIEGLRGLPALSHLNLDTSHGFADLDALDGLPSLHTLNLSACIQPWSRLKSIEGIRLPVLRRLNLSHCYALSSLDMLQTLDAVESLSLERCVGLTSTQGLASLAKLRQLNLTGCDHLTHLDDLGRLHGLEELSLHHCFALKGFGELSALVSLKALDLCGCEYAIEAWLEEVGDVGAEGFEHLAEVRRTCLAEEWDPLSGGTSPFH